MHSCAPVRLSVVRFRQVAAALALLATSSAFAQLSPGPNPVTGTVGAQTLSGGTGTVSSGGTISAGSGTGVTMSGTSTLNNNGTIIATSGRGIDNGTNNSNLTVNNTGLIQSTSSDAVRVNTANTSINLTNSGTIQVTAGGQAIDWAAITTAANTLTNQAGGVISAVGEDAVRPGQNGIIVNAGTIQATPTGTADPSGSDGIDLRVQKTVTVTNTGTISGRHGIATDGANAGPSSLTLNNNAGTIFAINGSGINIDGVNVTVTANVTNAFGATIRGGVSAGATDGDGDGIDVDGVLTLNNSGDVLGLGARGGSGTGNNAEGVAAGGGSITNNANGRIIGSSLVADAPNSDPARGGNGILIDDSNGGNAVAATTVTNSGLIQGKAGFGVKFVGTFADTVTNNAGGTIRGTGAGAVVQTGDGGDTVTNAGTIQHDTGGTAVDLGAGNDTLNYNGGTITGAIDGGSGTNTLNLGSGVTHNHGVANFQNISISSGSSSLAGIVTGTSVTKGGAGTLVLTGANTYTGGTTVTAGTLRASNASGSATGTGPVLVQGGATLAGNGSIAGNLTLEGVLAPGNAGIGQLMVGGNATWNASPGNAWQFDLGAGNQSDRLVIGGDFLKGTGTGFIFDFLGSTATGDYILADWAGITTFALSDFSYINLGPELTGNFAFVGSQLNFTVAAIPEPSTYAALLGLGALGAAWFRRRNRPLDVS